MQRHLHTLAHAARWARASVASHPPPHASQRPWGHSGQPANRPVPKVTGQVTQGLPPSLTVVCHRYQLDREYGAVHTALDRTFRTTRCFVDDGWPASIDDLGDAARCDAVLWFVRFRELAERPRFDWGSYAGIRCMYDQDVIQDFTTVVDSPWRGRWPSVIRKNGIDVVFCTGRSARDHLVGHGIDARWIPKAVDTTVFRDLGLERDGVCTYGARYPARRAMVRTLRRQRVELEEFSCPYAELNGLLNRYRAAVVCNMQVAPDSWWMQAARTMRRQQPPRFLPSPETMLKNYEVAASGTGPFFDWGPELEDLGFIDGGTAVVYETFDDLIDRLRWYLSRPDDLARIAGAAAALCVDQHSWDHRAQLMKDELFPEPTAT